MARQPSYTDRQLEEAVALSRSWRGVLRHLGLVATSSSALRSVRRNADRLGLDYGHFSGQRRWNDDELARAISNASTWGEAVDTLGLADISSTSTLRAHAARLAINVAHLEPARPMPTGTRTVTPELDNLRKAGPLLAASWLTLCGYDVSWPLEPQPYDLVARRGHSFERIQVKTATVKSGNSWTVWLSRTGRGSRSTYDLDEVDSFFVIDAALGHYLIPAERVGGLHAITLSAYDDCRIRNGTIEIF